MLRETRLLGGYELPRLSFILLNSNEDAEGEKRLRSMTGIRECVLECYTCIKNHDSNNPRCPLASFEKV